MKTKRFDYQQYESKIHDYWKANEIYRCKELTADDLKIIDTPPPYANGTLHHGHGMSYTQLDIIARYLRQRHPTILPLAFDNNGLPTERYTEIKYGIQPGDHPDDFFQLCRQEAELAIKNQQSQFEALGFSYDHDIAYTTIDDRAMRITQQDFIDLYNRGLIIRDRQPQLFCISCQTALAQADIEKEEKESQLYWITFNTTDGKPFEIATTRPELIPAATAIFYHPEDSRYNHMSETHLINPIDGRSLPILEDNTIDPEFGSGLMMCSTFGDQHDIELYRTYKLDLIPSIDADGKMIGNQINGLSILTAREKILNILQKKGRILKKKSVIQSYSACERCSTPIEIINTMQWQIDILSHKTGLLDYIEDIEITPGYMKKRLIHWINGLQWNWIISRQRYFGIPIPAWICESCEKIDLATQTELPLRIQEMENRNCACGGNLRPDGDIFDTWMTSSLTPLILEDKYFMSGHNQSLTLRSQAHEIIRTWAFYTILKAYLMDRPIPWKHLLISGWGLGFKAKGKKAIKASKSSGTGKDPKDLILEYGADAFRYWAANAKLGKDQYLLEAILNRGRKLVTKLYNAAKLTLIIVTADSTSNGRDITDLRTEMISNLNSTKQEYEKYFEKFDYTEALALIEDQFWNTFCAEHLEEFKSYHYDNQLSTSDRRFLTIHFKYYLRLFAPFMPFITEFLNRTIHEMISPEAKYRSIHQSQT